MKNWEVKPHEKRRETSYGQLGKLAAAARSKGTAESAARRCSMHADVLENWLNRIFFTANVA